MPVGTQTDVQPGLLIITRRHYSRTTDTAVKPRPTGAFATPARPTVEELQSGDVLTLRALVAKEPREQRAAGFARLRVVLEGDRLSLTPIENSDGRIAAGVTSRYVRVE